MSDIDGDVNSDRRLGLEVSEVRSIRVQDGYAESTYHISHCSSPNFLQLKAAFDLDNVKLRMTLSETQGELKIKTNVRHVIVKGY